MICKVMNKVKGEGLGVGERMDGEAGVSGTECWCMILRVWTGNRDYTHD